jgi:hypothetical protein
MDKSRENCEQRGARGGGACRSGARITYRARIVLFVPRQRDKVPYVQKNSRNGVPVPPSAREFANPGFSRVSMGVKMNEAEGLLASRAYVCARRA